MKISCGFTLPELMIALAISAILAVVAVPGYQHMTAQANLNNARLQLLALQSGQERFYLKYERYASAAELPVPVSEHFVFEITQAARDSYQLTARRLKLSGKCDRLSLSHTLQKQPVECW